MEALTLYSVNKSSTKAALQTFIAQLENDPEFADKLPKPVLWYPQKETVYSFDDLARSELRKNP